MFEIVNDDGRTPDHGYTISSPTSQGLGELIIVSVIFKNWFDHITVKDY